MLELDNSPRAMELRQEATDRTIRVLYVEGGIEKLDTLFDTYHLDALKTTISQYALLLDRSWETELTTKEREEKDMCLLALEQVYNKPGINQIANLWSETALIRQFRWD